MKRLAKRIGFGLLTLLALSVIGFVIWGETPLHPMPEALDALKSDSQVTVTTRLWMVFTPTANEPNIGVILYPGGHVDPRAYAPLAHRIASKGYLVIIPPMPLNLAVFSPNKARDVIAAYPNIAHWVVGGHSLGGSMAANTIFTTPAQVDGLLLWASYPASNNSLASRTDLSVLSIYGTEDGGRDGIDASHSLLPSQTRWVVIEGGNHAQFGWYGLQPGDGTATISREEQQNQILQATLDFLAQWEK